jgi:NTP pyrophosphatase (non-canonical NTP hydrolase)
MKNIEEKRLDQIDTQINIFYEIQEERDRQDEKFGEQNHSPVLWCTILGEEVGEVNKAALENHFGKIDLMEYRQELIQTAAVCFAMIECFDRNHKIES